MNTPFSKLKIQSYFKIKYEKKTVIIDFKRYEEKSAYEVVQEIYKEDLSKSIELFLMQNDLKIRKVRNAFELDEVDMACIRVMLKNTFSLNN
jgi:hypothetical protein